MRFLAVLLLALGAWLSQGCLRSRILRFQRRYDGNRVWNLDVEHIRAIRELQAAYMKAGRRSQNPFRDRPELNSEFVLSVEVMILKGGNKLSTEDLRILKRVTANDVEGKTIAKAEYYASPMRHLTTYSLLPDGTLKKAARTCRKLITLDNYIAAGYPAIYFDMLKELQTPGRLGLSKAYSLSGSKHRRSHGKQPGKKRRPEALPLKSNETNNNIQGLSQAIEENSSKNSLQMTEQKMRTASLVRNESGSLNQHPAQTTAAVANYETTISEEAGESETRTPKPMTPQTMVDEESSKRGGLMNATQNLGKPADEEALKEGNREEVDTNPVVSTVPRTEKKKEITTTPPRMMDGELGTKNEAEHGTQNYAQKTEQMMHETPSMMNREQQVTSNSIEMTTETVLQETPSMQKNEAAGDSKDLTVTIPQGIMEEQTSTKEGDEGVTLNLTQAADQGTPLKKLSLEKEEEDVTRNTTKAMEQKSLDANSRTNEPSVAPEEPSRREMEGKGIVQEPPTTEQGMLNEMPPEKREAGDITHSSSEPTEEGMPHENNPSTEEKGENADNHLTTTIPQITVEEELSGNNEVSSATVNAAESTEVNVTYATPSFGSNEGGDVDPNHITLVPQRIMERQTSEKEDLESTTPEPDQTNEANMLHERPSRKKRQREDQNLSTAILPKMADHNGKDDSESVTRNPAKATQQGVLHEMPSMKKKGEGVTDNLIATIPQSGVETPLSENNEPEIVTQKQPLMSERNILERLTTKDEHAGDAVESLITTIPQRATERRDSEENELELSTTKYGQTTVEDVLHKTHARNGEEGFIPKPPQMTAQEGLNETISLKKTEIEDIKDTNTTIPETIMEEQASDIEKLKDITPNPAQDTELTTVRTPETPIMENGRDVINHSLTTAKARQIWDKVASTKNRFETVQASETTEHEVLHNAAFLRRKAEAVEHLITKTPKKMTEAEHSGQGLAYQTQNPFQSSEQKIFGETPAMENKGEGVVENVTTMNRHHHLADEEPSGRGQLDMNSLNLNQTTVSIMLPESSPEKQDQGGVNIRPTQTGKQIVLGENSAKKAEEGNAMLTPTPLQVMSSDRKELESTTLNTSQPDQERVLNEGSSSEEKRGNITETRQHHPPITEPSLPKALPAKNEQNSSNEYYTERPEYEVFGQESSENSGEGGGIQMLITVSPENKLDNIPNDEAESKAPIRKLSKVNEENPIHGQASETEKRGGVTSNTTVAQMKQRLRNNDRSGEKEQRSGWQKPENATEKEMPNEMPSRISEGGEIIQKLAPTAENLSKDGEHYLRMDQEKVSQRPEEAIEREMLDQKPHDTNEHGLPGTLGEGDETSS